MKGCKKGIIIIQPIIAFKLLIVDFTPMALGLFKKKDKKEDEAKAAPAKKEPAKQAEPEKEPAKKAAEPKKEPAKKTEPKKEAAPKKAAPKKEAKPAAIKEDKAKSTGAYFVSPHPDGGWQVKKANAQKALKRFDTKAEAEKYAKSVANNQDTHVVRQKKDGKIQKKH